MFLIKHEPQEDEEATQEVRVNKQVQAKGCQSISNMFIWWLYVHNVSVVISAGGKPRLNKQLEFKDQGTSVTMRPIREGSVRSKASRSQKLLRVGKVRLKRLKSSSSPRSDPVPTAGAETGFFKAQSLSAYLMRNPVAM